MAHLAHKIELEVNNKQRTHLSRAAGTARFAFNWALAEWKKQYQEHKEDPKKPRPSQMALRRQLNAIKLEQFPWMTEVTKCAPQMAIVQLGVAFSRFFKQQSAYPKFRRKGKDDRFTLSNDQFKVEKDRIRIPLLGWVKMTETLRFKGKIIEATVSRKADRWFVSISVELADLSHLPATKNQGTVGVDLGISTLATLSTGEKIDGPRPLKHLLNQVKRLSRNVSRKKKGSQNHWKAKLKLARLHARIANIRKDALHKLTTYLTQNFHTIVIEDLNVKGMMKNHRLARAIADMGFYEFRRQLTYKAELRGGLVVLADRFFPSSKTCSSCGHRVDKLPHFAVIALPQCPSMDMPQM